MSANILIIDDDPASCSCMKVLLTAGGHSVVAFGNGVQGLKSAFDNHPDLIISDSNIPGLDGCELAHAIKEDDKLRKVPLVVVTGSATLDDRKRLLGAGFDYYFSKPIVPETFFAHIEELLPPAKRACFDKKAASISADSRAQLLKELSDSFARNVPTLLASIWSAYAAKDLKQLKSSAHKTLGSCIFLKEAHLIEALRRLERSIDASAAMDLEPLLKEITAEIESACTRAKSANPAQHQTSPK